MNKYNDSLIQEKIRLLDESLMLIERLKKMRALGASPRAIGINPNILRASGLGDASQCFDK